MSARSLDTLAALETTLRALAVERVGVLYAPHVPLMDEEYAWRVTFTTVEGDSRDGGGATLAEALMHAALAISTMRDEREAMGTVQPPITPEFSAAMGRLLLASKAGA